MSERARWLLVGLPIVGIAVLGTLYAEQVVRFVDGLGPAGPIVFSMIYVAVVVALLPASVLTMMAGFLYGPVHGFLVVWPSAVIAAVIAFLLGRTLLRERVLRRVEKDPRFLAVDRAIAARGAPLLLLLRSSPLMPFAGLNYAMSVTGIGLPGYIVATAVGAAPGIFLYAAVGASVTRLGAILDGTAELGAAGDGLYWGGLVLTVIATAAVTVVARRALEEAAP